MFELHNLAYPCSRKASVHATSAQVGVATANLLPHISLSASLGSEAFKPGNPFTAAGSIWSAGVSLTQPIFHGSALMAQRRAAIADYSAALAQYQQTVLNAFQNIADKRWCYLSIGICVPL